jgi:hypothetical protein
MFMVKFRESFSRVFLAKKTFGLLLVLSLILPSYLMMTDGASTWVIQTVDSAAYTGLYTSLVLDSRGYPHISYLGGSNDLMYAEWTGSAWVTSSVYSTGVVGDWSSLALDSKGYPCISFPDSDQRGLMYAKWTGSVWDIVTVDSSSKVGDYSSLALDGDDKPSISYQDSANIDLKYAKWTGSSWDIQTVDSTGSTGYFTSLTLDSNGKPFIAYQDVTNGLLKFAKWTGSAWVIQTVASTGKVGNTPSIALDSKGNPQICYFNGDSRVLGFAKWSGSAWTTQTVESVGVSSWPSLVVDSKDNPCISYTGSNRDLRYAKWSGSTWVIEIVDSSGNTGMYTSLALDKLGNPCISYHDYGNSDLKYAASTGQAVLTASMRVKVIDGSGSIVSGATITSTTQPSGQTPLSGASGVKDPTVFSDVLAGSYTVQVDKTGYVTATGAVTVVEGATADVTVTLILLPVVGDLKVSVKDKDGAPLAGVTISSTTQPNDQAVLNGLTAADGVATFTGVKPGAYNVQTSKTGYVSGSAQGNVVAGSSFSINLTLQTQPSTGGVPGFPFEALIISVMLSGLLLLLFRRPSTSLAHSKN